MRSASVDPGSWVDAALDPELLTVAELQAAAVEIEQTQQRLLARRAWLLGELAARTAGRVTSPDGVDWSLTRWLRESTGMSHAAARRALEVGTGLAAMPLVRAAAVAGQVRTDRAEVLATVLVPAVDAAAVIDAEPALLEAARLCEPGPLKLKIREWIADHRPEVFERQRAAVRPWLQIDPEGTDRYRVSGILDPLGAETLKTALEALKPVEADDRAKPLRESRAVALVDLARVALAAGDLPDSGGLRPQVTVIVRDETLRGEPGPAARGAHTGPLTRPEVRFLACDAVCTSRT